MAARHKSRKASGGMCKASGGSVSDGPTLKEAKLFKRSKGDYEGIDNMTPLQQTHVTPPYDTMIEDKGALNRLGRKRGGAVKKAHGGPLTTKDRNALPKNDFVFPGERRYPINDENHARNALARVSQHGSEIEKEKVRRAVHRKYPSIGNH